MKKMIAVLILPVTFYAQAQWSGDPTINTPICTETNNQYLPDIISDDSGGAIITWEDFRNGSEDLYVQRVNASGVVQWATDGVAICTATGDQDDPTIASDGSGGAIIAWVDFRSGSNLDIYAQRIDASGAVQWAANGLAICTATANIFSHPAIVSDGLGGAIITWVDERNVAGNYDIYAQRISATGAVQWIENGVAICIAMNQQLNPALVSDGSDGAVISWVDFRNGSQNDDVYAQRINASGAVQWTANGVAVCIAPDSQQDFAIISDGSGGAIITWRDRRSIFDVYDIYAQRINASGAVGWATNGVAICTADGDQLNPTIVSDDSGGAIIIWEDTRNGISNADIYAQRVNASGAVGWDTIGVAICTATGHQLFLGIVSDGSGGAIFTWGDRRDGSGNDDIYAQRINSSAVVQWTANGVAISTATGVQLIHRVVSDGATGAIITWQDDRGTSFDVYAQRVQSDGSLGGTTAVDDNESAPSQFSLQQNYPNPFNPSTTIRYTLSEQAHVTLKIYSTLGQEVAMLVDAMQEAGDRKQEWDATGLASGVYFYRLSTPAFVQTRKVVLLR